jgi:hypothetical protein
MMSRIEVMASGKATQSEQASASPRAPELNEEDRSKDTFFVQVAELAEAMMAQHGRDFAIGTLVLAAKFIAEGKPFSNRGDNGEDTNRAGKPGGTRNEFQESK